MIHARKRGKDPIDIGGALRANKRTVLARGKLRALLEMLRAKLVELQMQEKAVRNE